MKLHFNWSDSPLQSLRQGSQQSLWAVTFGTSTNIWLALVCSQVQHQSSMSSSEVSWSGAQVERQRYPIETPTGQMQAYVKVLQRTSAWLTSPLKLREPFIAEDGKKLMPWNLQHPELPSVTLNQIPIMSMGSQNPGAPGLKLLLFM